MDEIEFGVLVACREYAIRQTEMLPLLAAALGVEETQVFYSWALRRCAQPGKLADRDWAYRFHGLECDLKNQKDGRFLRIDFGPKGRVGILNLGGVERFIMTSVLPWPEFPNLRTYFAKSGPPFDEYSGSWEKMSEVWGRLESKGLFEQADPNLVSLMASYTTRGPDGLNYVRFPHETTEETRADCSVAHRQRLSHKATQLLKTRNLNRPLLVESAVEGGPTGEQAHKMVGQ